MGGEEEGGSKTWEACRGKNKKEKKKTMMLLQNRPGGIFLSFLD